MDIGTEVNQGWCPPSHLSEISAVWSAHSLWERGVVGSNPTFRTRLLRRKPDVKLNPAMVCYESGEPGRLSSD